MAIADGTLPIGLPFSMRWPLDSVARITLCVCVCVCVCTCVCVCACVYMYNDDVCDIGSQVGDGNCGEGV